MKERHIGMLALFGVVFGSVVSGFWIGQSRLIDVWSAIQVMMVIINGAVLGGIIWSKQ